jgi:hypothetical protein
MNFFTLNDDVPTDYYRTEVCFLLLITQSQPTPRFVVHIQATGFGSKSYNLATQKP